MGNKRKLKVGDVIIWTDPDSIGVGEDVGTCDQVVRECLDGDKNCLVTKKGWHLGPDPEQVATICAPRMHGKQTALIKQLQSELRLATAVIKALDAYDNFECAHHTYPFSPSEERCHCGDKQMALAKEWNLAKMAYDKFKGK